MLKCTLTALLLAAPVAGAQSLASRVTSTDGTVQVIYPARPGVCGDGSNYIGNLFGEGTYFHANGITNGHIWPQRACLPGPARVVAMVVSGEVSRLRPNVGPIPASDARTVSTGAAEAAAWLSELISQGSAKVASEAMLPLVLADAPDPWPFLLRVARDENRPRNVRRSAIDWLARGVNDRLGLTDDQGDTDDDEMRKQAVFALSQRPKNESVPELIEIARTNKRPAVRRSAIFWLGQTGDSRALDVFAELLKLK